MTHYLSNSLYPFQHLLILIFSTQPTFSIIEIVFENFTDKGFIALQSEWDQSNAMSISVCLVLIEHFLRTIHFIFIKFSICFRWPWCGPDFAVCYVLVVLWMTWTEWQHVVTAAASLWFHSWPNAAAAWHQLYPVPNDGGY